MRRYIDEVFDAEDFAPQPDYVGNAYGQRRTLVGSYHANIDFGNPEQIARLVKVYLEAISSWVFNLGGTPIPEAVVLLRSMQRDDVPVSDDGRLAAPLLAKRDGSNVEARSVRPAGRSCRGGGAPPADYGQHLG